MKRSYPICSLCRGVSLLLAVFLLLTACTGTVPDAEGSTDGVLTLPGETTSADLDTVETDPLPPLTTPDPEADLTSLVITSYYATGKTAGDALVAASYVEIHNGSGKDIPLRIGQGRRIHRIPLCRGRHRPRGRLFPGAGQRREWDP